MLGTELKPVIIHTDGGCQGNPGPGGWASIMRHNEHIRELSGGEPVTTCNRMELTAAIQALKALKRPCAVTLFTDSQYLRSGITEWIHSWKRRNWQTAGKKPVQNADLWRELEALTSGHKVQWQWLKGHAGHGDNERCDQLATAAISEIRKKFSTQQLSALRKTFQSQRLHGLRQGTTL